MKTIKVKENKLKSNSIRAKMTLRAIFYARASLTATCFFGNNALPMHSRYFCFARNWLTRATFKKSQMLADKVLYKILDFVIVYSRWLL